MKYLVYDIESIVNKPLLNRVLFAGENLSDEEAYQKHLVDLLEKENRDFVNPAFHRPVTIAAIAVNKDLTIQKIGLLGGEPRTTFSIVQSFWDVYNSKSPNLVDFNGKGYDVRLLELWAFQLGITIGSKHFSKFGSRYRFSEDHIDVHEWLTNFGAIRYRGGLNLFSKMLGKPGKMETKGNMVEALFAEGKMFTIDDYCLSDAMDTYFVFLRTRVMLGEINLEREKFLVDEAKRLMEIKSKEEGYFKPYLEHFGDWVPDSL